MPVFPERATGVLSALSRDHRGRWIYDYIVVGAGAAGSVVAARLSEDPTVRVLVLEAGPSDLSVFVRMPAAMGYPIADRRRIWPYESGPEPGLDGRLVYHARGKMLGGSSSLNGMVYVRGNPKNYDDWARNGLATWSYAHCLPYFKRLERYDKGENDYRGGSGPVSVSTMKAEHPVFQAFLRAGEQYGYKINPDYNAYRQEGVHAFQANIDKGVRDSTGRAYLAPALSRQNLDIALGALVRKILLSDRRAVGVEAEVHGEIVSLTAEREVVLCGGAFNSPQLLLLSGIGAEADLKRHGIPVVAHLPGVGRALEDHAAVSVRYRASRKGVSPGSGMNLPKIGLIGLRWALFRSGLGASNLWEVGSFIRSSHRAMRADIEHEFLPMLATLNNGRPRIEDGFRYQAALMRPRSRGFVELMSADPRHAPRLVTNYLTHPDDCRTLIDGIRRTNEMALQRAWDAIRGEPVSMDIARSTDTELLAWLRSSVTTQYHPCSTCRMGTDEMSVVDAAGRVHGLSALRVIDASIFPTSISGNPHCPTIMAAEKLADDMRGRPPLPSIHLPYAGQASAG